MGIKNSFFEWMLLWFSKKNEKRTLRIIGSNSLKHPCGDIDFARIEKSRVLLGLNEMSLCGVDSPLPDCFLRSIRTENENSTALAEFLNMLQHHLAMLRFNAILEKSNFLMNYLGNKKWQNCFAFYNENFSQESLRCFFAQMFPDCKIEVHCFEPLKIENPAPIFLSRANLNGAMLLGKICTSLTSAMRVNIASKTRHTCLSFENIKFPFKIKINFVTKVYNNEVCRLSSQKLSENFWLGNKNFETLKWEKWV
jgi:hypothetical protein